MKLTRSQVNKYNKLADKGKHVMIDTDRYGTVAWEDGDYGHKSIIASDDDGKEVEIDFNNVVRVNEAKTVKLTRSKLKEMVKEEMLSEAASTEINTKSDLQRALKSAFNEIFKAKTPKELHRGDTGEMLLTTETDGRGARVEIVPHTIADAVRELK